MTRACAAWRWRCGRSGLRRTDRTGYPRPPEPHWGGEARRHADGQQAVRRTSGASLTVGMRVCSVSRLRAAPTESAGADERAARDGRAGSQRLDSAFHLWNRNRSCQLPVRTKHTGETLYAHHDHHSCCRARRCYGRLGLRAGRTGWQRLRWQCRRRIDDWLVGIRARQQAR